MKKTLTQNISNAPIIGNSLIKIFEIGKIFQSSGEKKSLCVGIVREKNSKMGVNEEIRKIRDELVEYLGAPVSTVCTIDDTGGIILLKGKAIGEINKEDGIFELNLDSLIEILEMPKNFDIDFPETKVKKFSSFSQFPFIVRDVAVYVPSDENFESIIRIISRLEGEGRLPNLYTKPDKPFDEFLNSKLGKKSFAFRLIFQSFHKTLTDKEVNETMENLYNTLKDSGFEVR
jgi:phenylalanyl-tRNA synthetase beta subunit